MSVFRFAHRFFGGNEIAILAALVLQTVGIFALSSATHTVDNGGEVSSLLLRQAIFFGVGVVMCTITIAIPIRILQAFSYLIFALSILSLVLVLAMG